MTVSKLAVKKIKSNALPAAGTEETVKVNKPTSAQHVYILPAGELPLVAQYRPVFRTKIVAHMSNIRLVVVENVTSCLLRSMVQAVFYTIESGQ